MSREIISEAMNGIRDEYVSETVAQLGLFAAGAAAGAVGASAGGGVDPATLFPLSGTETAAKAGFGAWVAKGGWVALAAGVLVAAGVAAGAFFFGKSGDVPPVGTGEVTAEATEPHTSEETEETTSEAPNENESVSETESESERGTESESETKTEEAFHIPSFLPANTFLSMFTPVRCKVSVNEDGSLTAIGNYNATLNFPTVELMKLSPDYTEENAFTPYCILIQYTRENCRMDPPGVDVNDLDSPDTVSGVGIQHFMPERSAHEYLIITVGKNQEYLNGSMTDVRIQWIEEPASSTETRSITIHEISFYPSQNACMRGLGDLLEAEGLRENEYDFSVSSVGGTILHGGQTEVRPFLTLPAKAPDGSPIVAIGTYCFRQNHLLCEVTVPEGIRKIEKDAFENCLNLSKIMLPHSLNVIDGSAFDNCDALTEVHLGAGIQYIGADAFTFALQDVYYNGTVEEWRRVVCIPSVVDWRKTATVHCTDGDIPAMQEHTVRERPADPDLSDLLTMAAPIPLKDGQAVSHTEATVLTVYQDDYLPIDVILRWAVIEDASHLRGAYYYFDVLSMEDGRMIGAMPMTANTSYPYLKNAAMMLIDTEIFGVAPSILFVSYSSTEGTELSLSLSVTSYGYSITANEDGTVSFNRQNNYEGGVIPGKTDTPLETRKMKVMSTLAEMLAERDYPAYVLISTNPITDCAFYSVSEAPQITEEYAGSLAAITCKEFSEAGLKGIYEAYGLCPDP